MAKRKRDDVCELPPHRRGAIKAFREYLNSLDTQFEGPLHSHGVYQQRTRAYGDYLYAQDRDKFNDDFSQAMEGTCEGFDAKPWRIA